MNYYGIVSMVITTKPMLDLAFNYVPMKKMNSRSLRRKRRTAEDHYNTEHAPYADMRGMPR